jgi:multidrug resistance efflux pump
MSQIIEAKVPDIGDYHDVPVIDVCVKAGDTVKVDDPLVTLESDKATMDVYRAALPASSRRSRSASATRSPKGRSLS